MTTTTVERSTAPATAQIAHLAAALRRGRDHGVEPLVTVLDVPGTPVGEPSGPVVPVYLYRDRAVVGPRWEPGRPGPCPTCLRRRWLAVRSAEEQYLLTDPHGAHVVGEPPYLTDFAVEAIASLVERAAGADPADGVGTIYDLELTTLALVRAGIVADSACPDCALPADDTREGAVLELRSRVKPAPETYRLRSARSYDLPLDALVNPTCGMLGPASVRAYHATATAPVSGYFRVRSKYAAHDMWWGGHGASYRESEILGVLEGLERYCGQVPRAKRTLLVAAYEDVADHAFDPREIGSYDPSFYEHHHNYLPFAPDREMPWVWGYSIRDDRPVLIPEQMVYYLDHRPEHKNFVQECSNGCASGSTVEEAILYGILELVERDAFLIAWYGGAKVPRIDPASCSDPVTRAMLTRVDALGYETYLFDMRMDVPIPVVMGLGVRRDGGLGTLCFAAGAGLDPESAVRAALCEVASYVPAFDQRVGDKQDELRAMIADYRNVRELSHHALLYGMPEMAEHADFLLDPDAELHPIDELYADWEASKPRTRDLLDDLAHCRDLVTAVGSDLVVVDQTAPEQRRMGLRTVSVTASGLVPIDFGWDRQRALGLPRLRRALVDAGFRDTEPADDELNRNPHPFP